MYVEMTSTFQRRSICIFNCYSTLIRRRKRNVETTSIFRRRSDVDYYTSKQRRHLNVETTIKNISNSHPNVFIENKQIKQVYECKTLGVKIDQHLSWKGNTDEICKKVTAGISAIRRIRPFVAQDTLILIYNAMVRPYFDYCSEV